MNFQSIFSVINNLTSKLRPSSSQPAASTQNASGGGSGSGQPLSGPKQQELHTYHIRPMVGGNIPTRVEEVSKSDGTLSVNVAEIHLPSANGTIINAADIALVCGVCGDVSEKHLFCDDCSKPLCIPDLRCVKLPDTSEILHLCPPCCKAFYARWNTWRGPLPPPFSYHKEIKQGQKQ